MTTGWERLATFEGGTVSGMARAQAADGSWHVFAATPVGVFRSVDRGHTWAPLGTGARVAGAEVVTASPRYAEDSIVFAGAHDGVYRLNAPDGPWQPILTQCVAHCIAVDAGDRSARPDGSGLTVFVGTEDDGILVSRNGGRSWGGSNVGLSDLCVFDLALSPSFAEDGIAFAAMSDGLYRTRNGGEAWRQLDTDTQDDRFDAVTLSPTFADDRVVLASTAEWGLFRSDDGGRSWALTNLTSTHIVIGIDFWSGTRAVAWTDRGVLLSQDGGESFLLDDMGQAGLDMHMPLSSVCLPADADNAEVILAGTSGAGVRRSLDAGATWTGSSNGLAASLISQLVFSPQYGQGGDQTVYAVSLDEGVLVSREGGRTWSSLSDPDDDLTIRQIVACQSTDGSQRLVAATDAGLFFVTDQGGDDRLVWQSFWADDTSATARVVALANDGDSTTMIVGQDAGQFTISRDSGASWEQIGTPFAPGEIVAVAVSSTHSEDGTVYVATIALGTSSHDSEVVVWRSANRGHVWGRWLEERTTGPVQVVAMPADANGSRAVIGLRGRVLRPRQNAWETKGGVRRPAWDATDLPGAIAGLTASPAYAQDRTLFAATSAGVFVSRDGGATFLNWNDGLEPQNCVAVAVSPAYAQDRLVYALGLGGTVWRRTDA